VEWLKWYSACLTSKYEASSISKRKRKEGKKEGRERGREGWREGGREEGRKEGSKEGRKEGRMKGEWSNMKHPKLKIIQMHIIG
jgi:flagellar biosynthesis/type III secretory pathway protein FliH